MRKINAGNRFIPVIAKNPRLKDGVNAVSDAKEIKEPAASRDAVSSPWDASITQTTNP